MRFNIGSFMKVAYISCDYTMGFGWHQLKVWSLSYDKNTKTSLNYQVNTLFQILG